MRIPDSVLKDLPDDPEFAFVELDTRIREVIVATRKRVIFLERSIIEDYHSYLFSFKKTYDLDVDVPTDVGKDPDSFLEEITYSIDQFRKKVRRREIQKKVEAVVSMVKFSSTERNEIHNHLEKIRNIVHESDLSTRKKNSLLSKIASLSKEVDRIGTRTDALMGLYLDATLALGQGAKNANAFIEEAKEILRIVFRAKAREEGIKLPPLSEISLLEKRPSSADETHRIEKHSNDLDDIVRSRVVSFSPQFLDEIRSKVPLVDAIGRRVRLVRRGREHVGLCPFHEEKTPSFTVNEDKGFFHCFGCGAHGDVIGFEMRIDNIGFVEVVERLTRAAGLQLPVASGDEILPNTR